VLRQYTRHGRSLFKVAHEACSRSMRASPTAWRAGGKVESALSAARGGLFAVAEACPDLRADTDFRKLWQDLDTMEDAFQVARRTHNEAAREQNNRVGQFPGNLLVPLFLLRRIFRV